MKLLKLLTLVTIFLAMVGCKNGYRKTICAETGTEEYQQCHQQSTGVCDNWQTSCSTDSFGDQTCNTRCVSYQTEPVCETREREVCTRYEYRYYCKATKQWMTASDFQNTCPAPAPKGSQNFVPMLVAKTDANAKILDQASKMSGLPAEDIVSMIETHSATPEQLNRIKSKFRIDESVDAFSLIEQMAEENLEPAPSKN
jgi:hypothetical protein